MPSDEYHYCSHPGCKRSPVDKAKWEGVFSLPKLMAVQVLKEAPPEPEVFIGISILRTYWLCDDHLHTRKNIIHTVCELNVEQLIWVMIGEAVITGTKEWELPIIARDLTPQLALDLINAEN